MSVHLPIPVIYTVIPSNNYIPRIFRGQKWYCYIIWWTLAEQTVYWARPCTSSFGQLGLRSMRHDRPTTLHFATLHVAILRLTTLRNSSIGFALPLFAWLRVATLLGVPRLRRRALVFAPLRLTPEALRSMAEGGVPNMKIQFLIFQYMWYKCILLIHLPWALHKLSLEVGWKESILWWGYIHAEWHGRSYGEAKLWLVFSKTLKIPSHIAEKWRKLKSALFHSSTSQTIMADTSTFTGKDKV